MCCHAKEESTEYTSARDLAHRGIAVCVNPYSGLSALDGIKANGTKRFLFFVGVAVCSIVFA